MVRGGLVLGWLLLSATPLFAVLDYSGERLNDFPVQWRGFLLDHRALRMLPVPPSATVPSTPLREQYLRALESLEQKAKQAPLTDREEADRGALLLRLRKSERALQLLRTAQRAHPRSYPVQANLAIAWWLQDDLKEAVATQLEVVRLAPEARQPVEKLLLRLLQDRLRQGRNLDRLDRLFDSLEDRTRLPENAVGLVQQLALSSPGDGQLLWQLAELAWLHRDVRNAAAMLDGCVTEFNLSFPEIRKRRQLFRDKADAVALLPDDQHAEYRGDIRFKSARALLRQLDRATLPAIRKDAVNPLPWVVLEGVVPGKRGKNSFPDYLRELDGLKVSLTGYMQPLGDEPEMSQFLFVEFPIGCWFCETPERTALFRVVLPEGEQRLLDRKLLKLEGVLSLNHADPEEFLYVIREAKLREPD